RLRECLVVEISCRDLAARKKEFAWGGYDIPESMGVVEPEPTKIPGSEFKVLKKRDIADRMLKLLGYSGFSLSNPNENQRIHQSNPPSERDVFLMQRWRARVRGLASG